VRCGFAARLVGGSRRVACIFGTIGTVMAVVVHVLRASAWSCLPAATGVAVREAGRDDWHAVQGVVSACRGEPGFAASLSAAGLGWNRPRSAVRVWLAERADGGCVGAIGLVTHAVRGRSRWSMPFLLVSPGARRCGVATGLVRAALQAAATAGVERVMAETLTAWADASAFWCRMTMGLDTSSREGFDAGPSAG